jgi:hypothetical protein
MLPSRSQPNLYPQLPPSQQADYYRAQPGTLQTYNSAGPSQSILPYQQQQQLFHPQQQQQYPSASNQVYGYSSGAHAGGMSSNTAQVPSVYHAPASNQIQPVNQGGFQHGMQAQQFAQGGNQGQPGYPQLPTSLPAQNIEEVSSSEDPVYGPLGRARGKVHRAIVADEEISLDIKERMLTTGAFFLCLQQLVLSVEYVSSVEGEQCQG